MSAKIGLGYDAPKFNCFDCGLEVAVCDGSLNTNCTGIQVRWKTRKLRPSSTFTGSDP